MRIAAPILLAAALSGCAATTSVSAGGGAAGVAPGGTVSSATVGMHVESASAAGALLGLAIIGGTVYGAARDGARVPPLDPDRTVNVQDCSQPIRDWAANLRCK